jgi:hypothetical protein
MLAAMVKSRKNPSSNLALKTLLREQIHQVNITASTSQSGSAKEIPLPPHRAISDGYNVDLCSPSKSVELTSQEIALLKKFYRTVYSNKLLEILDSRAVKYARAQLGSGIIVSSTWGQQSKSAENTRDNTWIAALLQVDKKAHLFKEKKN